MESQPVGRAVPPVFSVVIGVSQFKGCLAKTTLTGELFFAKSAVYAESLPARKAEHSLFRMERDNVKRGADIFFLHVVSFNKTGCGSAKEMKILWLFISLCSRLALSFQVKGWFMHTGIPYRHTLHRFTM